MNRIYDMIKGLLPKKVSANSGNYDKQPKRSEEELETICKSKSLLQKTQDTCFRHFLGDKKLIA